MLQRGGPVARRATLVVRSLASWRPSWRWLFGVVRAFVTSFVALAVALWLLPGEQTTSGGESVAGLAVGVLALGAVARPLLVSLTVLLGSIGLLVAGLVAQGGILALALAVVPTVERLSWPEVVLASWAATLVSAAVNWLFDTSTEEAFLGQVLGSTVSTAHRHPVTGPGLLVVQLDGVSEPLLRLAMTSGAMPHLAEWLRTGDHRLRGWHTGVPATTPAGQAVLLHGNATAVPGFRWYDKGAGRLLVSSRPSDLGEVEAAMTTGRGLLADGGVSISNLFSGDAPTRVLTMSDARLPGRQRGAAAFMYSRSGFTRSVVLFLGQILTEWHQGRRQRRRNVVPRVRRTGAFVFLRGLTTVILHDLNVSLVADQMARGAPVVFVDFVDYDEVAHHAGPSRPETLHTLEALDRILGFFRTLSQEVGRDYEIVVLSDHGQAQGSTFEQLAGETLADVVARLAGGTGRPADAGPGETRVPAALLGATERPAGRVGARGGARPERPVLPPEGRRDPMVLCSGSLAHVYLPDEPGRVTGERVEQLYPGLVAGLASYPHVGLVLTRDADGGVRVQGAHGWRVLRAGSEPVGEGTDPTLAYGARAAADLLELDGKDHVGDLVLLGGSDTALGEVAAFEELVGSHGGLGGWQTRAFVVHPSRWPVAEDAGALDGTAVHRLLLTRLEQLGLREASEDASEQRADRPADQPAPESARHDPVSR